MLLHPVIEGLCLSLADALVEMTGRGLYQVGTVSLVHPLGENLRIEHHGEEFITKSIECLPWPERQPAGVYFLKLLTEIVCRKARHHLLTAVVMIDAVGKPDTLQINLQSPELVRIVTDIPVRKNNLHHLANPEVVLPKLIECDIPAVERGFRKIINQFFLLRGKVFKTRQLVS